ncbi:MAG: glycosyltransferase family 4 protein [Bacteroidaceae bacterium]|nr:glycosyltransferase family 4 protein [Bacteroidaceae bacterium]
MKVLEIIYNFYSGGNVHFTVDMCNHLIALGHDVTILSIAKPNEETSYYMDELDSSCKIVSLNEGRQGWKTFFAMARIVKKINPDILHINSIPATTKSLLAMRLNRKAKCVVTSHNQCQNEDKKLYRKHLPLIKAAYRLGWYKYVAISQENANSIREVYGKNPTSIIYNGRDFMPTTDKFDEVRRLIDSFKKTDDTLVFTIMARCNKQKNIPRLVRCFNEVRRRGQDVTLLIMGADYDNEIGRAAKAEAMDHIHFLDSCSNVADYLANSDFFTLSSDFEGMPLSLIEALSYGCIPVSTPVSGVVDIIQDGVTGFVSDDFTDEAYIDAIERAIQNKDKVDRYELVKLYKEHFTMERCAKGYEELFNSLVS